MEDTKKEKDKGGEHKVASRFLRLKADVFVSMLVALLVACQPTCSLTLLPTPVCFHL